MARFLLIRHGHTDAVGKVLTGRQSGVHLSETGQTEARNLVTRLANYDIDRIVSSPLERAVETATPLAETLGLEIHTEEALTEVDFGEWQGKSFDDLEGDKTWWRFNHYRSSTLIPGGETMHQIQARMSAAVLHLHKAHASETIALFSHGDPLKTLVCYFCCIPLDCMLRFDLTPASLTVVDAGDKGSVVRCINSNLTL